MDEAVRRALEKWPAVPACNGWLRLTRRGDWAVPDGPIRHAGLIAFINRNYGCDEAGRWHFQNGPQKVFVTLAYTPFVLRIDAAGGLETHTGLPVGHLSEGWLDEEGSLLLASEHGIGLLDDRDLAALAARLHGDPEQAESPLELEWAERRIPVGRIARAGVPARFGFDPQPPAG